MLATSRLECLQKLLEYHNDHHVGSGGKRKFFLMCKKTYKTTAELKELAEVTKRGNVWCEEIKAAVPCSSGYHLQACKATYHEERSLLHVYSALAFSEPKSLGVVPELPLRVATIVESYDNERLSVAPHTETKWSLMKRPCMYLSVAMPTEVLERKKKHAVFLDALCPFVSYAAPPGLAALPQENMSCNIRNYALSCEHAVAIYKCEYAPRTGKFELLGGAPTWSSGDKGADERLGLALKEVSTLDQMLCKFSKFGSVVGKLARGSKKHLTVCEYLRQMGDDKKKITLTLAYVNVNGGMLAFRIPHPHTTRSRDMVATPALVNHEVVGYSLLANDQVGFCDKYFKIYRNGKNCIASCRWDCETNEWQVTTILDGCHTEPASYDTLIDTLRGQIVRMTLQDVIDAQK
jgi:hypothetical protein